VEYRKRIEPSQQIAPLEMGFAGEQVSRYNGATTFSVTDISIPGNSALPVQLVRRLDVALQPQDEIQPYDTRLLGAGNWDVDVPYIAATYPDSTGWTAQRCSTGSVPPTSMGPNGRFFRAEAWQGLTVHLPGRGDTPALGLDASVPIPTGTVQYHLTTAERDAVSCIAMQSGLSGEGFRLTTAQGVSYDFNVAVSRTASKLVKMAQTGGTPPLVPVYLPRTRYYLLASTITDRFGNTVQFTYNSDGHPTDIVASDGREIVLSYSNGRLQTATSEGHAWGYGYTGTGDLQQVTLPDNSQWQYTYWGSLMPSTPPPYESLTLPWCQGLPAMVAGAFALSATHPGGATTVFDFANTRHYRSGVHASECSQYGQGDSAIYELLVPNYFDVMSLTQKQISGPGLPSATWTYDYGSVPQALWGDHTQSPSYPCTTCTTDKTVTVTRPDGSKQREHYGIEYQLNDGRLLQTQIVDAASNVAQSTDYTYMTDTEAAGQPFHGVYGQVLGGIADPITAQIRPQTQTVIAQDGTTFTTHNDTFDSFARVATQTQSNTTGASRQVATGYSDNLSLWVLGQPASTAIDSVVSESTSYYPATALPEDSESFGRLIWHQVWNTDGTLYSLTDGDANTTVFSNWKRGTPQAVQFADTNTASAVVNDAGWIDSFTDETGQTTNYQYDGMGRLKRITPPTDAGQTWDDTTLTFVPIAQAEHGVPAGHWKQTVQTGSGQTETILDGLWRPVLSERFDNGNKVATLSQTATGYDAMGRKVFVSYPTNTISDIATANIGTHTQYDALDRATNIQRDSELGTLTTTRDYLSNNRVTVTDPKLHATTTQYQAYGQPETQNAIAIAFADGTTTTVQRDVFGSPLQMQQSGLWQSQPLSVTHTFIYDAYHQLCLQTSPETSQTAYGHDGAGNLVWSAQGQSGQSTCMAEANVPATAKVARGYDARNRLTGIDYPAGTADESFAYYPDGKLKTATRAANGSQPQSIWTLAYNHRRLLTDETLTTDGKTFHIGYGYDSEGHRSSTQYPSGLQIAWAPDGLGRPTQAGGYASSADYAPDGTLTGLSYGNATTLARTLNTRELILTTTYALGGTNLSQRTLGYDENGNLSGIADSVASCVRSDTIFCNGFEGASLGGTDSRTYVYDTIDRLTQMTSGRYGVDAYTYDPLGNVRTNGAMTWHYNAATNRVSDENGTAYGYDARGNVTSIGSFALSYNLANEQTGDGNGGGYAYDARGWRVKQTGGGHTRYFVYDAEHRLVERLDNNVATDFIAIGSLPVARVTGGVPTYIHADYQNTPLFETSSSGAITRTPDYLAYGQPVDAQGTAEIPGYTGAAPDKDTGLLYLGARYLRAPRFLSVDPANLDPTTPFGLNRYAYANNNPARFTDPDGQCPQCLWGAPIGAGVNLTVQMLTGKGSIKERWSNVSWKQVMVAGAAGALSGGVSAIAGTAVTTTGEVAVNVVGNAGVGALATQASAAVEGDTASVGEVVQGAVLGGGAAGLGSAIEGAPGALQRSATSTMSDTDKVAIGNLLGGIKDATPGFKYSNPTQTAANAVGAAVSASPDLKPLVPTKKDEP
jgi:RHS repeat-associated protein